MFSEIRQLYSPVQPTVNQSAAHVNYSEFLPHTRLHTFIYCYWQLKTIQPLTTPFVYRVVADGCIDVFFEISIPNESFVMGFCRKFTEFPLDYPKNLNSHLDFIEKVGFEDKYLGFA